MDWRIRFEADGSFVTLTVTGVARVDGFVPYLEAITADPAWHTGMPVLVDYLGLDISQLSFADVEQVLVLHLPFVPRIGPSPIAVVVSRAVDFGMIRMFGALAMDRFPVPELFYAVDDAVQWLHARRTSGGQGPLEGSP